MDHIIRQLEELECVMSMFPGGDELLLDSSIKEEYEGHVVAAAGAVAATPNELSGRRLEYTIRFKEAQVLGDALPELEIRYPPRYPDETVIFIVHCPALSRERMEQLQTELTCIATKRPGDAVVLELYQCMSEHLAVALEHMKATRINDGKHELGLTTRMQPPPAPARPRRLGRRAIYFHHIIAPNKRQVVRDWAVELGLGGFSKIGWPGVVVVEGDEDAAQEYVRRLQHLRWQYMVVRGEQVEPLHPEQGLDSARRLPRGFCEFPEKGMSQAAQLCRECGLEELFLTVMKIYRPTAETKPGSLDDKAPRDSNRQKQKTSQQAGNPTAKN